MTSLKQKLLAGTAAAVLAVGGGIAVANVGTGESASAGQTSGRTADGPPGAGTQGGGTQAGGTQGATQGGGSTQGGPRGGGPGGQDLGALAEDLGVGETELRTAMQDAGPPSHGADGRDALAASLAEALDLSQPDVEAALEANRPGGAPDGDAGRAPSTDGAVTNS